MIQLFQQCCVPCLFLVLLLIFYINITIHCFPKGQNQRSWVEICTQQKTYSRLCCWVFQMWFLTTKSGNICMTKEVGENSVPLLIVWVNWAFTSLWNCSSSIHLLLSVFTIYLTMLCLYSLLWQLVRLDCSCVLCLSLSVIPHWVFLWTPPSLLHCFQLSLYYCLYFGVSKGLLCVRDVYLGGPGWLTFRFMMWCTCFEASASPLAAVVSSWEGKVGTVWSK